MGVTKELANFCATLSYEDLPAKTVNAVKHLSLDFVGVAARGATVDSSQIMLNTVKKLGSEGKSVTIGGKCRMSPEYAALVNGTFSHALDYDDVCNEASLHPAVAIFPAALAATEYVNGSGKDLILSVVVGYEVMCRLGKVLGPAKHYAHGFHPTATCGVFGATASVGRLLGIDGDTMANAFGIAGSQSAGSMEFLTDGTWTKRMHPGWAAHGGMIAALLAEDGFKGPMTIIEGKDGFLNSYSHETNPEEMTQGLGSSYFVEKTSIKPYSCCRYKHAPIDGIFSIMRENKLKPADVAQVTIGLLEVAFPIVAEPEKIKYHPENVVDTQFSMPFGAAMAILYDNATPNEYAQETVKKPEVVDMMQKVRLKKDPALDALYPQKWPATVDILTTDNKTYSAYIEFPKGDPDNPLSWEELGNKFTLTTDTVYGPDTQKNIIEQVSNLDDLDKLTELFECIL
jgi:2-methylcitrate dehydratase PrpD